jgi:hypothetical protein
MKGNTYQMVQEVVQVHDVGRWEAALEGFEHAVGHTSSYCKIMARSSGLETFIYCVESPPYKLVCPLSLRRREPQISDLVTPYGFGGVLSSFPSDALGELNKKWQTFCSELNVVTAYIAQHPCFNIGTVPWKEDPESHHRCFLLDLHQPLECLWQSLSKTHRYEITKNATSANFIIDDKPRLIKALQSLYPLTLERTRASAVYHFDASVLMDLCNLPNTFLIGAEKSGNIEAVSLFLQSKTCGEYFINAALPSGRMFSRNLIWEALRYSHQHGVKWFNMGGGLRPGDSLEQFKRGFGGSALPVMSIRHVANSNEYERLCIKYCGTLDNREFFPAYWRNNA